MHLHIRRRLLLASATASLLLVFACSAPATPPESGPDSGVVVDAGTEASQDAGGSPDGGDAGALPDAGPREDGGTSPDAGEAWPRAGFGVISGTCNVLDDELTAVEPGFFSNEIDFGTDPYDPSDFDLLTAGGQEIIEDGNAGGSSLYSEVFSFEMLHRCEGAELLKTETEIQYQTPSGKITDLLVEIDGLKVGVSVTRAVDFPFDAPYTVEKARSLLEGKLGDILESSARVGPEDAWVKQILHVMAYAPGHVDALEAAYEALDAAVKADTLVIITVTNGSDDFIY